MLSKQAITDFKKCWKKEFNEELSDSRAQDEGTKLLRLFQIIYKPIPKEWMKKLRQEEKEANKF